MALKETVGLIASGIGLFDTLIILPDSFSKTGAACGEAEYFMGYLIDCGNVTTSEYSRLFGIPITVFGFLFYATIFAILMKVDTIDTSNEDFMALDNFSKIVLAGSTLAFLISMVLVYIQLGVLELICKYCMLSAATSTTLFLTFGIPYILTVFGSKTTST